MSKPETAARPAALKVPTVAIDPGYPFAYAIIEGPPGRWTAVCLNGVTARSMEKLEPNGEPEPEVRAMWRIQKAIERRTIGKKWGKP